MESSKKSKDNPPTLPEKPVRIGRIIGCHGIRGDVKIRTASDDPDWVGVLKEVWVARTGEEPVRTRFTSARKMDRGVLAHLELFPDRTAAEQWLGADLLADPQELPPPQPGEYLVDDLIGLTVVSGPEHTPVGRVLDVLSSTAGDFLEIQPLATPESQPVIVPFLNVFFPEVDLSQRRVSVDKLGDFSDLTPSPSTHKAPTDPPQ